MEKIQSTIDKVLRQLKEKEKANPLNILKKYLTKEELKHIKFCNIRHKVLTIYADSSVWMYALNLKKRILIEKMKLKDIRFRLGR